MLGAAPQLITIGADKTLAIWDTISFKVLIDFFLHLLVNNICPNFLPFFIPLALKLGTASNKARFEIGLP